MHLYRFIIEISYDKADNYQDMPDWWEVCLCTTLILSVLWVQYRLIIEIAYDKSNNCQDTLDWEVYLLITFILSLFWVISVIVIDIKSKYTGWVQDFASFWRDTLTFDTRQQWKPKLASSQPQIQWKEKETGWLKTATLRFWTFGEEAECHNARLDAGPAWNKTHSETHTQLAVHSLSECQGTDVVQLPV